MITWVDIELKQWGKYVGGNAINLGYPSASVEARMQGGELSQQDGYVPSLVYMPGEVECTEQIIRLLPHESQAVAIVAYTLRGSANYQFKQLSMRLMRKIHRSKYYLMIDELHARFDQSVELIKLLQKKA